MVLRKKNLKNEFFDINKTLNKETNPINVQKLKNNCIKKTNNSNITFYNDNKVNKIISTNKKNEINKLAKNNNIINKNNNLKKIYIIIMINKKIKKL